MRQATIKLYGISMCIIMKFGVNKFIIMIQDKLNALNRAFESLEDGKIDTTTEINSIALITLNSSRPKRASTPSFKSSPTKSSPPITLKNTVDKQTKTLLLNLYSSRCEDLFLEQHELSWEGFVNNYLRKNQNSPSQLDLSGFNLGKKATEYLNDIVRKYQQMDLSRNLISIPQLSSLQQCKKLTSLSLSNCNLKNTDIAALLKMLRKTPIKKLILSSPDLKDRNQLTQYEQLYVFLRGKKSLEHIGLSNINIHAESNIFKACKGTALKILDLSKNTGVCGMNTTIQELNLSWNNILDSKALSCVDTQLRKLNLTGNPISTIQHFLNVQNYPKLEFLTLNQISISNSSECLRNFIQKSPRLCHLELVNTQLTDECFEKIANGLQGNHHLRYLNISKNKFSNENIDLGFSINRSQLREFIMSECDVKDQFGEKIFRNLRDNKTLEKIDVSKNVLGNRTSTVFCENLKGKCYNIIELKIEQNFIKYDHMKEIKEYIERNQFIRKNALKEQYMKFKENMINIEQVQDKIIEGKQTITSIKEESQSLGHQFTRRKSQILLSMQNEIEQIMNIEEKISRKINKIKGQLSDLLKEGKKLTEKQALKQ